MRLDNHPEKTSDPLTGLHNRYLFEFETKNMLENDLNEKFVMLHLDIFNFQLINECHSYSEGEQFLQYIAKMIQKFFEHEEKVTYTRTDSNHFFICFIYEKNRIRELIRYLEQCIKDCSNPLNLKPYFGIVIIEDNKEQIASICNSAKIALKEIKGDNFKNIGYFNQQLKQKHLRELFIVNNMHKALENKEFVVYLQPKYNILTNECVGAEALVRWNHSEIGVISPEEFIPIFEKNGFIAKLDLYMIEQVCVLIKGWINSNQKLVPISVNISRANLNDDKIYDLLTSKIEYYEIPIELLELEITESAYSDNCEYLIYLVEKLKNYGFKIHMDDFGNGYSSLSMLKELPVDVLKLDLRFLTNLNDGGKGTTIIAMIVRMAKLLGIPVIAEGVETLQQINFLQSIGCLIAQGYYFSKPVNIEEFVTSTINYKLDDVSIYEIKENDQYSVLSRYDIATNSELLFYDTLCPAGIFEYSEGVCRPVIINDRYFELTNITRNDYFFDTKDALELIHPDDHEQVKATLFTAINNKFCGEGECRKVNKKGDVIWVQYKVRYMSYNENKYLLYITMNDITDIKRLESEIMYEKIKNELLTHKSQVSLFEYNIITDTGILNSGRLDSKQGAHILENFFNSIEQLDFIHSDDKDKLIGHLRQASYELKSGKLICRIKIDENEYREHMVTYQSILDENKRLSRIVGSICLQTEFGDLTRMESLDLLHSIFSTSPLGMFLVRNDEGYPLVYANDAFYRLYGFEKAEVENELNNKLVNMIDENDILQFKEAYSKANDKNENLFFCTIKSKTHDNKEKTVLYWNSLIDTKDGQLINVIMSDITDYSRRMEQLSEENERFLNALSESNICVWEYDILQKKIIQTQASKRVHGLEDIINDVPNVLVNSGHIHEDCIDDFLKMYDDLLQGSRESSCTIKVKRRDGSWWWEKIIYTTIFDLDGNPIKALGISEDVTHEMANKNSSTDDLLEMAYKDELTGVGNRRACFNYSNELIKNHSKFSLSYIDLNGLKKVNDNLGHHKGDEYITTVVNVIRQSIRGNDKLFRIGGDEFILIVKNCSQIELDKKLGDLSYKIRSLNLGYETSISYGNVYIDERNTMSYEELLLAADERMYKFKNRTR